MEKIIKKSLIVLICATLIPILSWADKARADSPLAKGKKVMLVMSYHEDYSGEKDILQGIENLLQGATIKHYYLDTKNNLALGPKKAEESYRLYQEFQPDAVIAANDNAQSLFVVPYLKDKVKTPVIFCGVNNDATKYGYPASNVTGVLEKKHYREGISFAQIIVPEIKKIGILYKENPTNRSNLSQIAQEKSSYTAEITEILAVNDLEELKKNLNILEQKNDAILTLNMTGIEDQNGKGMEGMEVQKKLAQITRLPIIAADSWELKSGALCGVIQEDKEQGQLAAQMLLDIWQGKPIKNIPINQNRNGRRYININTIKNRGLKLPPEAIIGTKIVMIDN
ncbi:MAG: hypothetical protein KKB30_09370 [Proteobacteria bacterium]|nr:hypothetical protein [Pseudomonadota bacterium]MBU1714132.1 hypothetical protein [Pseudomonadota bacterium]